MSRQASTFTDVFGFFLGEQPAHRLAETILEAPCDPPLPQVRERVMRRFLSLHGRRILPTVEIDEAASSAP